MWSTSTIRAIKAGGVWIRTDTAESIEPYSLRSEHHVRVNLAGGQYVIVEADIDKLAKALWDKEGE